MGSTTPTPSRLIIDHVNSYFISDTSKLMKDGSSARCRTKHFYTLVPPTDAIQGNTSTLSNKNPTSARRRLVMLAILIEHPTEGRMAP